MAINSTPTLNLDYKKRPEQLVIDIINADNGTSLKESQLSFGIPEISNNKYNSRVIVSAKANTGLAGSAVVEYNRIDISKIPKGRSTLFQVQSELNVSDLVPAIDARYDLKLTPLDYIDGPLPALNHNSNGRENIDLIAASTSLVFINRLSLTLERPGILLSSVIQNVFLRGLNYVLPPFPYQIIP